MEAMDRLEARKAMRLDPNQVLKPVEVKTIDDIKRIIIEYDPKRNQQAISIPISTILTTKDGDKDVAYRVEANTKSKSKRDLLIEGLDIIKARIASAEQIAELQESVEVNGVAMKPAALGYKTEGSSWVDPLIRQWMGAYRDGIMLCWKLDDGYTYRYDLYVNRLVRVKS